MVKVANDDLANYRYERKFIIPNSSLIEAKNFLKLHPAIFSEIYHTRSVNNIYLDTIEFKNYFDNINGISSRKKYRIRWYGDLFNKILKPYLEIKIKHGALGRKKIYPLDSFIFDNKFNINALKSVFNNSELPEDLLAQLAILKPVLVNRYLRKYYQSKDKKYRITLDSELKYYRFNLHHNNFFIYSKDLEKIVLEMKYSIVDEPYAQDLSSYIPFRVDKNSKYVNGIEKIYMF